MCGRDAGFFTWRQVQLHALPLAIVVPDDEPMADYNRAPMKMGWAVTADGRGDAVAVPARWGLVPPWANTPRFGAKAFNARLETVASAPSFRSAFKARRALVPSSGFYEWRIEDDGRKQPYFVRATDAPLMFYAGLWEQRRDVAGEVSTTYTVLTRDADQTMATLHDRMPLILPADTLHAWLHAPPADAIALAHAVRSTPLAFHAVDPAVGNVRNNGPRLIEPLTA